MLKKMYEVKKISSCVNLIGEIEKEKIIEIISSYFFNASIVFWLDYEVLFGTFESGKLRFYKELSRDFGKYLLKARIFDENKELYLWRNNNLVLKGRLRKDYVGEHKVDEHKVEYIDVIDAQQVMFGKNFYDLKNGFVEVSEPRGIKYIVPKEFLLGEKLTQSDMRLILYTRNYIGYNEIGQAGFIDYRFVKIEARGGEQNG